MHYMGRPERMETSSLPVVLFALVVTRTFSKTGNGHFFLSMCLRRGESMHYLIKLPLQAL